ncbi:hypothetical protein A3C89_01400 [Candidatus Kaiserbacteria bacterium RIFCSPHIGHO2_02_FULL_50_50]|uniref:Uncharacterized protein n=1 Tax=Candidatus Kaiserbacteria bacterium RIFCSPHIGHO2_02_FULL_50_50 TaxID=1798492 RepID=A0A1F6DCA4_9BACT|nr:MAG: hypothetical protein A3C89_01400 [Candidatus Kaiserbacteria bacterium RIFCSPHIGHO2_02_FULL_50_50]OGG89298.1 MAG: hypothetical protein A3G62_01475 [Candidatus Kaiserbacteria bacterium RIFCSPLOWO2_12_FULL_50_10]
MLWFGGSALMVGLLIALFGVERTRGERFLPKLRMYLDVCALKIAHAEARASHAFESDTFRQTIHYVVHMALTACRTVFAWVSEKFDALIRINRSVAHRAAIEGKSASHLHEMMQHKRDSALTETQKKQRKAHAIGMRS